MLQCPDYHRRGALGDFFLRCVLTKWRHCSFVTVVNVVRNLKTCRSVPGKSKGFLLQNLAASSLTGTTKNIFVDGSELTVWFLTVSVCTHALFKRFTWKGIVVSSLSHPIDTLKCRWQVA